MALMSFSDRMIPSVKRKPVASSWYLAGGVRIVTRDALLLSVGRRTVDHLVFQAVLRQPALSSEAVTVVSCTLVIVCKKIAGFACGKVTVK